MAGLTFMGGTRTVTGSSYLLELKNLKIMVDCGLFQGNRDIRMRNYRTSPVAPSEVDFLLLTHAHIDHSGLLPRFCKQGFKGQIITSTATRDLCTVMLPDSGHIQEMEVEFDNRKALRRGEKLQEPLYTAADGLNCLRLFKGIRYEEMINLNENVRVRFRDAGHILGSAIVEIWVKEDGNEFKIVFSGDLGKKNTPIINDPAIIEDADFLLIESTYGNRLHEPMVNQKKKLAQIINRTMQQGGNIVIPAFAVERTQEILYFLNEMLEAGQIPKMPVYVDSPLAISATEIFMHNRDYYDAGLSKRVNSGKKIFDFPGTRFTRSADESKQINASPESKIIISASGMADAGRIKHHLKHNLWRPESTIVFVGYQAEGTLGRLLVEGEKKVKIFGETINVAAHIESLQGLSAHADQKGLLEFIDNFKQKPQKVFVVHGEIESSLALSGMIENKFGIETVVPYPDEVYELSLAGSRLEKHAMPTKREDMSKRALLAIVHLEKKLDDLKEDLIVTGGSVDESEEFEKMMAELEGKVADLGRIIVRK